MGERQAQRLPAYRLFQPQVLQRLRDRGRPDHLVAQPVAERGGLHLVRQPAADGLRSRLDEDVGHRVAHAQVGAHRAVEHGLAPAVLEDAEDVGGGAADVDAQHRLAGGLGVAAHHVAHGRGRGHHRHRRPPQQLVVARRVAHDVGEEELVDGFPGGREILRFQGRADVVHHRHLRGLFEYAPDVFGGVAVAGVYHRKAQRIAEPGPGRGRHQGLGHLHDVLLRAAVDAAGQEHDVRSQVAQPLDALVVLAAVVRGDGVHHDGAGAQGRPLRGFRAHLPHHARHRHLQPAPGGAGGEVEIDAARGVAGGLDERGRAVLSRIRRQDHMAAHLLDLGEGVQRSHRHVRHRLLHGGGSLAPIRLAPALGGLLKQQRLGGRGAAVGDQHGPERCGIGLHATKFATVPYQSMSMNRTRSTSSAVRAITVDPKKAPKHTIRSQRPEREKPLAARFPCRKEKKK